MNTREFRMQYYKKNNNELLMPNQAFMDKYCKFMVQVSSLNTITLENEALENSLPEKIKQLEEIRARGQDRVR